MLTGLEQYYLERAGYFIRRAVDLPEQRLETGRPAALKHLAEGAMGEKELPLTSDTQPLYALLGAPALLDTLYSALGPDLRLSGASLLPVGREAWRRSFGPSLSASEGEQRSLLARFQHGLCLHLPFLADEGTLVLPATHLEPLGQEEREAILADPLAALPGQVRVRLQPGDALFCNANLLHRADCPVERSRCTLVFTVLSPAQPGGGTTPLPVDAEVLAELPPVLRPLLGLS